MNESRGSEKLYAAWKARTLTEESVAEIAQDLDASPGSVESIAFTGGSEPTGVAISLRYSGDDFPECGTGIRNWLKWMGKYGGSGRPPRIIINGIPCRSR